MRGARRTQIEVNRMALHLGSDVVLKHGAACRFLASLDRALMKEKGHGHLLDKQQKVTFAL
jgi:hypothetical protein